MRQRGDHTDLMAVKGVNTGKGGEGGKRNRERKEPEKE